jgi:PAS domain S-box-containing protein
VISATQARYGRRTRQQLGGQRFDVLTHPGDTGRDKLAIAALLSGERMQNKAETRFRHVSGAPISVALQATTIHNGVEDTGRRFLLQVQDVTHRRHYEENLHYLASHDPLTGLHNRSSFAAHADLMRRYGSDARCSCSTSTTASTSTTRSDTRRATKVITRAAHVLAGRLRETDILARLDGDEFAALLPRADTHTAERVARDLLTALRAERIAVPGTDGRMITASVGVAMFNAAEELSGADVLVNADLVMYDAKEAGRNQVARHIGGEHAQAHMPGRITWSERIRVAIDEQRFALVAQPIFDL